MTTTNTYTQPKLDIDPTLLQAAIEGTQVGLQMTGVNPPPVGASRFFCASRSISIIIGLVGASNGNVTLNMSERVMMFLAGKFMGETYESPNEETFDAVSEIGNMVAGSVKDVLEGTEYRISNISVPSVILGASYNVFYTRGIHTVSVDFQLDEIPMVYQQDRLFTTTVSLLRSIA